MKRIFRYSLFLFVCVACNEDFLECPPLDAPATETFYSSYDNALLALNGVYNGLHNLNYLHEWEDVLTDNERWYADGGTNLYGGIAHGVETPTGNNPYMNRCWYRNYLLIQRANSAIEQIEKMDIHEESKNKLIAQCRFFRGFGYHYLIWRFGDVPLLLPPVAEQPLYPFRAPKADIVTQIYSDFEFAGAHLPNVWTGSDIGRVTKGGALGFLAREYLWNKEYAKAAEAAKKVMDISDYGLLDDYMDLWKPGNNNTKEGLFEVQYWTAEGEYQSSLYYRWLKGEAGNTGARGNAWSMALQDMVNAFENSDGTPFDPAGRDLATDNTQYENRDPRLKYTVFVNGMDYFGQPYKRSWSPTTYTWRKYTIAKDDPLLINNRNAPFNWIVLRYAEVLLLYAEAKNEVDGPVAGVHDAVNQVRNRAGMPDLPADLTKDEMRERIYNERRVELASEGTRLEDLNRWRRLKQALENKHLNHGVNYQIANWEEFRYLWPIQQQEMDANPNLVQNPGY